MSSFKYFPIGEKQKQWGIYLTDCGHAVVPPKAPYPPAHHPAGYAFTWHAGRTLNEYQLLYVERGGGVFESQDTPLRTLSAGDLVLLSPGFWHRYRPDPKTGWTEHWVGFNGALLERVMSAPFFPRRGVIARLAPDSAFVTVMKDLIDSFLADAVNLPYSSGGRVLELLGLAREGEDAQTRDRAHEMVVRRAQFYIGRHVTESIDFKGLAKSLGLGYTVFRRCFAEQCGYAPLQYQLQFRLRRAKNLLVGSDMAISDIAVATGFKTVFYFSRFFRKQIHTTPRAYRRANTVVPDDGEPPAPAADRGQKV